MRTSLNFNDDPKLFRACIDAGSKFKANHMYGRAYDPPFKACGSDRVVGAEQKLVKFIGWLRLDQAESLDGADYVVWSYQTPIGWRNNGRWHIPSICYSQGSTRARTILETAVADLLS